MVEESDWRIAFAEFLRWQSFRWKKYHQWSEQWDHDHCAACRAQFCIHPRCESFKEGYAITEDYHLGADYEWVCKQCFLDLRENLGWKVALE